MDGDGSSSGDVSSMTTDEVPLAYPELPPPMGPTENDAAVMRWFARLSSGLVLSRMTLGGPNAGHSAILFESTRDGDGGGYPRHVDAGADDDGDDGFSFGAVPASGVAIACLPETTVGEARESGQCAVCLEEYEAGDALRTMPCAHGFHEHCIFGWLRASRLCPLCRFALPAEEGTEDEGEVDDNALEFTYDL